MFINMNMQVLTGPEWLAEMFDGTVNTTSTAKIEVRRTAENTPFIGLGIKTDPAYAEDMLLEVNGKTVGEWLTEITVKLNEETGAVTLAP